MSEQTLRQIEDVIRKATVEGVLTHSAIEDYNGLIVSNKALREEVEKTTDKFRKLHDRHEKMVNDHADLKSELVKWKAREDALIERENEMTRLELEAQFERERVNDHKEMFGLVFRNIEIRRSMYRNSTEPSGEYGTVNTSENRDETETEQ